MWFFLFRKSHFPQKKKKNSIIAQQQEELTLYTLLGMTTGGFGTGRSHPDPTRLFFSILKLVSFKKLNKAGRRWENSQTRLVYILFLFLFFNFNFFYICFFIFIILKLIFFIKIKKNMIFYKLFLKKYNNNNYYLY